MPFADYHIPKMVDDGTSLYYISGNKKTTVYKFTPQTSGADLPGSGKHMSASPNPAVSHTKISFDVSAPQRVAVSLCDIHGKAVFSLAQESLDEGTHERILATDGLPEGVYFCRIEAGATTRYVKVMIAR